MPIIVDHDLRRLEIAEAVARIVARVGIHAVTMREVGKEAGYSSTIVGHYFKNKRDLLTFTYMAMRQKVTARVERVIMRGGDIFDCLSECLPTDRARRTEWQVWFGCWAIALNDRVLARERKVGLKQAHELFVGVLSKSQQQGDIPEHLDCTAQAMRLQFFLNGIATIVLQDPASWPAKRQIETLKAEVDMIRQAPSALTN